MIHCSHAGVLQRGVLPVVQAQGFGTNGLPLLRINAFYLLKKDYFYYRCCGCNIREPLTMSITPSSSVTDGSTAQEIVRRVYWAGDLSGRRHPIRALMRDSWNCVARFQEEILWKRIDLNRTNID